MIKTLAHICIFSKDLNRSLDFYCGALGLKRHFDFFKDGALFGFYLQAGPGHFIEIFKADPDAEIRNQRIHHFCLEVEDIDAMRDALIKRGVEVTPKKTGLRPDLAMLVQGPGRHGFGISAIHARKFAAHPQTIALWTGSLQSCGMFFPFLKFFIPRVAFCAQSFIVRFA